MSNERSKGIVGIFILITLMFVIFLSFAFYTISNLQSSDSSDESVSSKKAQIGVVSVEGVIMDGDKTIKELMMAEKDNKIKAIIVRINSPGGAVGPTQEIYDEIRRINEIKPVYASFGTVAASGGYYIGAACKKIYAPAGSMTGSIGVIMNFMNLSKLYDWAMLRPEIIKSGKYKDIGSPARSMTNEEKFLLTEMTANVHEQFIMDIYKVREKKIIKGLEGLREYAQGQIFSGQGAKDRGLVDEIGGLWKAGRDIHKELKLKSKFGLKFIKLKDKISFSDILRGMEEKVQDISYSFKSYSAPMFLLNK